MKSPGLRLCPGCQPPLLWAQSGHERWRAPLALGDLRAASLARGPSCPARLNAGYPQVGPTSLAL